MTQAADGYRVHLFWPYVPEEAVAEVAETLRSRWIGQGPKVERFEAEFGARFGQRFCVSVNSGTSALETAYELVGIRPGDEVITTPLTCTATNLPLLRMGARLVWADVRRETLCLEPSDVLAKLTPRTRCVVNVHLGGVESVLPPLPVPVVSDSAQALGVFSGDYTACSFQAIKHITTGDGGMLVCPDEASAREAKLRRWFGIDREAKRAADWQPHRGREMTYDIEIPGHKRQMTDVAAALGLAGLRYYDEVVAYRRRLHGLYRARLAVPVVDGPGNVCWLCQVLLANRDEVAGRLREAGVETNVVQVRNDAYKVFGGRVSLPVLDEVETQYLSLPLHTRVSEADVERICEVVNRYGRY